MRMVHVLRKPLSEGTVAANTLKHGTGGINIDASRISSTGDHMRPFQPTNNDREVYGAQTGFQPTNHAGGRWPANVILHRLGGPGCPVARLDEQSGDRSSPWVGNPNRGEKGGQMFGGQTDNHSDLPKPEYRDTGGASRFYKQVGGSGEKP